MLHSIFRNTAFAVAIFLSPTYCFAQDVFGTLDASLDGVERTWFLTSQDTESRSFGMTIAIANLQTFSLWGQQTDKTVNDVEGSLLLGFDVMSVGGNTIPLNVSLTYLADGWKSGWIASEASQIVFSLTTLEDVDDGRRVEGNFTATANYSYALATGQVDPSRAMQINGRFNATLPNYLLKKR